MNSNETQSNNPNPNPASNSAPGWALFAVKMAVRLAVMIIAGSIVSDIDLD